MYMLEYITAENVSRTKYCAKYQSNRFNKLSPPYKLICGQKKQKKKTE